MNNNQRRTKYKDKYKKNFPYNWVKYCKDPLEKIEGWNEMLKDTSGQRWVLHHRDEIPGGGEVVSKEELINRGEYYNLPADKLIFMTAFEHMSLHKTGELHHMYGKTGEVHPMYGHNKYGITKEELHKLYIVQRLTPREIAEKFKCGKRRIQQKLKKFGISRNKYDITKEELQELYVVQRLTQQEIGDKFGCSQMLVCYYLKKFKILSK